jgi:hypothetical protein
MTPVEASEPEPAPKPAPVASAPKPAPKPAPASSGAVFSVEKTIWHPVSEKRVAVVALDGGEPREVREGDEIGPAVVARIEPSGVVFDEQGQEIRRRVGE